MKPTGKSRHQHFPSFDGRRRLGTLLCLVELLAVACGVAASAANETAPSPCGKTFEVTGFFGHYRTPANVRVSGDGHDGTYEGEIFGPSFTANVRGLPAGTYTIQIDLAEVYHKLPGQRVMRITSGGTVIAARLDIVAQAGFAKPWRVQARVDHQDDAIWGPLAITFTGITGDAKFNAIKIVDAGGDTVACVKAVDCA